MDLLYVTGPEDRLDLGPLNLLGVAPVHRIEHPCYAGDKEDIEPGKVEPDPHHLLLGILAVAVIGIILVHH